MIQRLVFGLAGLPVDLFYRRWHLGGRVPSDGPLLLVSNHPNGLIDPVLLGRLADRPVRFLAKAPLLKMPVLGAFVRAAGALPVYRSQDGADTARNADTFNAVFAALSSSEAVCLFPEGLTHDEPSLQRMKTGAARMALGAEAQNDFGLGVRILPVGLVYGAKEHFRSKVAVWVGTPISTAKWQTEHARDDRGAVQKLTAEIEAGLREVTVNLDRWDDLPLISIAERLWSARGESRVVRLRAFAQGLGVLRRQVPDRIERLEHALLAFSRRMDQLGIQPDALENNYPVGRVARFLARNLFIVAIGVPLGLAGMLAWLVPYALTRLALAIGKPERELVATFFLITWMVLGPLAWCAHIWLGYHFMGPTGAIGAALITPWLALCALRLGEYYRASWDDARVFLRVASRRTLARRLGERAEELGAEIEALASLLPAYRTRESGDSA